MKYLSLFSGIGGFELGIQNAYENNNRPNIRNGTKDISEDLPNSPKSSLRPTCVGYSEIDPYAIKIYQKHFPEHKNYGDITKINEKELPDFDLLVGGFPCQSFSIAGKRRGFRDTRGTLFFDIARIVKEKQPRLLLLENVKGLLSHDSGQTFFTIIATLDELGYDLQWQVLNSKDFGVPQNRERIIIVGHLRGTPRPEVFPLFGTNGKDIQQINNPVHSNDRIYDKEGVSPTLNTMQGGNRQPFIIDPQGRSKKECVPTDISPTLRANTHGNQPVVNAIRRLTPIECERLQGFPDNWTEGVSDTQRYKMCGNAVTTNVIRAVIEKLIK